MLELKKTLAAWQSEAFRSTFKNELEAIKPAQLPLQAAISQGSYVAEDEGFTVVLLNDSQSEQIIEVKTGIFYNSIIAGCACDDDPTPVDLCTEYCELMLTIDKTTAETGIELIDN